MTHTFFILLTLCLQTPAQGTPAPSTGGDAKLKADIVQGLKNQPAGATRLESFALPDEFLGRVADRIIRMDYQKQMRAVRTAAIESSSSTDGQTNTAKAEKRDAESGPISWVTIVVGIVVLGIIIIPRLKRSPSK